MTVVGFDRAEERDLLNGLFATVAFDKETTGVPAVAPDPDDEDDDGAADADLDDASGVDWSVLALSVTEMQSRMPAQLQRYWIRRLRLGTHGSFRRCVRALRRHYPVNPEGLCANLYHEATGRWPGAKKDHDSDGETTMAEAAELHLPGKHNQLDHGRGRKGLPSVRGLPEEPKTAAAAADGYVEDDCPPGEHRMPDGKCMPDEAMATQPGEHFHTVVMEGVSTGKRMFAPESLSWREPPFAFHWQQKSSAHSGTPETVQVGLVTRAERHGGTIHFWGPLDLRSPEGLDYARRLVEGFVRWSSIGLDESLKDADVEFIYPQPDGAPAAGPGEGVEVFGEPDEMVFHRARIAEISGVSVPALADATVEPTAELLAALVELGVIAPAADEPAAEPVAAAAEFGAVGGHDTATDDGAWDGDANVGRLPSPMPVATGRKVFAWVDDTGADGGRMPKTAGRFPHHAVSADGTPGAANLTACTAGIAALHGARGGTTVPAADRKGTYAHLAGHLRAAGREPPALADAAPVVAAGYTVTIPDLPPAAWFNEPVDASPHGELRVDESGRICGYLAPAGVAHRAFRDRRVEVPMGRVDYDGWMSKPWPVAEGHKVYVGVITMGCGHASTSPADASYTARREHYDNSCSVAAHARIGENRHGVWIAGALAPWVDAEGLGRLMSCQLSGDWASHRDRPGWQDFVAALLVPVPGFPNRVPSASVRVADGALVASAVPVRMVHSGDGVAGLDLRPVMERMARSIGRDTASRMAALRARVHRGQ